jgi:hypothetical protein
VAFLAYRGYRLYRQSLAQHALRLQEVADLNFATIEALALAIDAKDQTSQQHIKRLELFATALARGTNRHQPEQISRHCIPRCA